jgi:transketolase
MDMRAQLAATASDLVDHDPRAAIVLAEISESYFHDVISREPARVVNVGIMEQTMVGVAAGFAMEGFRPIVHTFAPFMTERALEQIKLDFGYQGLGGTFASVGASYDYGTEGGTHHSPADVSVMLSIPGMDVMVPGCGPELDRLMRATHPNDRPTYVRASISQNDEPFEVDMGKLEVVRRGVAATVVAFGPMLSRTLAASEGLDVAVVYATSLVPFDSNTLASVVGDGGLVIPIEPWYEGTSVRVLAEALRHTPARFAPIGVPHRFIRDYGTLAEHDRAVGLDATGIRARLVSELAERG